MIAEPHIVRLEKRARRRTFLDIYDEANCYLWFAWIPDGYWGVTMDRLNHESIGEPPSWFDWASESFDKYTMGVPSGERAECGSRALDWLLAQGLVPGQPFRMRVGPTQSYVSHTQDGTEYDDEADSEVVEIYPWPAERVAKAIIRFREDATRMAKLIDMSLLKRDLALKSSRKLSVRFESYFAPGQSSYDDMCMPAGLQVRLWSEIKEDGIRLDAPIASGRSDSGSHKQALSRLQAEVFSKLPTLGDVDVTKLPRRW